MRAPPRGLWLDIGGSGRQCHMWPVTASQPVTASADPAGAVLCKLRACYGACSEGGVGMSVWYVRLVCPYDARAMSVRCPVVCSWYVRGKSSASGHTKRPPSVLALDRR